MKQNLEALVRAGKFKEALGVLRAVKLNKIHRADALDYANIAGRIGQLQIGLKILNPIVRGENLLQPASDAEKIQYANLLRKLGAVHEAIEILSEIDSSKNPEAALNLAFCESTQWRYAEAIPYLRNYLEILGTGSYKSSVAKVNLLAALIHENHLAEARSLIGDLVQEVDSTSMALLLGNVCELTAQLEIKCQNWNAALTSLDRASQLLQHAKDSPDGLYIEKWRAVVESLRNSQATELLFKVKDRALSLNHWETYRDCEFYIAKLTADSDSLIGLYFGTPLDSYRKRILLALGGIDAIPTYFLWEKDKRFEASDVFDLVQAKFDKSEMNLPSGQVLHRLMIVLSQDFYKPVPLISIFAKLFPSEHFNPDSSPNRTYQVIKRLRQWFLKNRIPMQVQELAGAYRLEFQSSVALRIPRETLPLDGKSLEILRFKTLLPLNEFTAKDVGKVLSMSRSETQRILRTAVEAGIVESLGFTNQARYRKIA